MKKNLFALLNICTILLSLFLTGCSGKESKITLNSSQPECILSNNDNIVLESYTNESVLDDCRNNFKKLEDGDEYCTQVWQKFKDLSLKEFQRIYDILGTKFESVCGESFYTDKMPEIVEMLEKSGKLIESQGAKVVDLEEKNMPPCIIIKSNKHQLLSKY